MSNGYRDDLVNTLALACVGLRNDSEGLRVLLSNLARTSSDQKFSKMLKNSRKALCLVGRCDAHDVLISQLKLIYEGLESDD